MPEPRLYLAGLSGAGKSTAAARIAGWLGWTLFDVDREIERDAGRSVAEIWAAEGEAGFRRREAAAVERLVGLPGPVVAALGGGTLEDAASRERLAAWGVGVHLDGTPESLAGRLGEGAERPLLADGDPAERLAALAAVRGPRYQSLAHSVAADRSTPAAVAVAALRALSWAPPREVVPGVELGAGALAHAGPALARALASSTPRDVVVATDVEVWGLHGAALDAGLEAEGWLATPCPLAPGEAAKDPDGLATLWRALAAIAADRDTPLLVLGGGALGDVGGLAAATFKRGVPLVLFPTTVLAQVDAAIGGKNAIDLAGVKNVVGTFYLPERVVVDPLTLLTLDDRDYRSGWAEVVKAGLIGDAALFERCEREADALRERRIVSVAAAVEAAIRVKMAVVDVDFRDTGPRRALNLGHTLGHALEAVGEGRWTHGEAVSIGIVAAARFGERLGITQPGVADRIATALAGLGLPVGVDTGSPDDPGAERLEAAIRHDKKRDAGTLHAVFPVRPGEVVIEPVDAADVREWIDLLLATTVGVEP